MRHFGQGKYPLKLTANVVSLDLLTPRKIPEVSEDKAKSVRAFPIPESSGVA